MMMTSFSSPPGMPPTHKGETRWKIYLWVCGPEAFEPVAVLAEGTEPTEDAARRAAYRERRRLGRLPEFADVS
jgi:hypothetical protein